ncbi:MAG: RNA polymerase sigma factor, partial [Hyphomicrobiaceae bacterium]
MHEPCSEHQLALEAAKGDREALAALLEAYYDDVYHMAWRWCGAQDAAEDVAQDVCIKLATAIRQFRGDAQVSTWIWRITYNTAVDHLRNVQRLKVSTPSQMCALVDGPSPDTPETQMMNGDLWHAVRRLPPQQRDAVLLVYGQDMNH